MRDTTIRISSDGTRPGTNIIAVTPDGEETRLPGITGLDWTINMKTGIASATLRVHRARLDALLAAGDVVAILEPAPRRPWWRRLGSFHQPPNPRPQPTRLPARVGAPTTPFEPDPPDPHRAAAEATAAIWAARSCPRCGATDPWQRRHVGTPDRGMEPCPHAWHEHAAWQGVRPNRLFWTPRFDVDKLELEILGCLELTPIDYAAAALEADLEPNEFQAKRLTAAVLSFLFDSDSRAAST